MSLLTEEEKDQLVDKIIALPHLYDGVPHDVTVIRAGEDVPQTDKLIVVSFLPSTKKYADSIDHFMGKNGIYNWYGYYEEEKIVIMAFAHKRAMAHQWLREIEKFLKVNFTDLVNGFIDRSSVSPYREIYSTYINHLFGFEMVFSLVTLNEWTDKPDDVDVTDYPIDEVRVDKDIKIWVKL